MSEEEYKKELEANGVDVPETKEEAPESKPEAKQPEKSDEVPEKGEEDTKDDEPKDKKRSIYDAYKEKKTEAKSERELRLKAEQERDELLAKVNEITKAKTPEKEDEAEEDAIAYAQKVGANPELVNKIIEQARKGIAIDDSTKKEIEELKAWKAENQKLLEKQQFDAEFSKTVPTIKTLIPTASDEELPAIKAKLDEIAHSKEWNTKDLDYIVFKHKDELSKLTSPKKRGMETKERKDAGEIQSEFDVNADYSKMTLKEREAWEEGYKKLTKNDGLSTDARGRKIII